MTTVPVQTPVPVPVPAVAGRRASSSFWRAAWYRYRRNKLALVAGAFRHDHPAHGHPGPAHLSVQ